MANANLLMMTDFRRMGCMMVKKSVSVATARCLLRSVMTLAIALLSVAAFGDDSWIADKIKAAESGSVDAQYELRECYYWWKGVVTDERETAKWYHKAAEEGNADAQFCLAACYATGEGAEKDEKEAVKWYRKVAERGQFEAHSQLDKLLSENPALREER